MVDREEEEFAIADSILRENSLLMEGDTNGMGKRKENLNKQVNKNLLVIFSILGDFFSQQAGILLRKNNICVSSANFK